MYYLFCFTLVVIRVISCSGDEHGHSQLPEFTLRNLDWQAGGTYRARGISVPRIVKFGEFILPYTYNRTVLGESESEATLVVDPPRRRMFLDMGSGGQYWYFDIPPDGDVHGKSYIVLNGICGVVPFNYTTQVTEYSTPVHMETVDIPRIGKTNLFIGENKDVGSCYETIGVIMGQDAIPNEDGKRFISVWGWAHPWWLRNPQGKFVRSLISGTIILPEARAISATVADSYFHLPAACSPAIDYCAANFPQRIITYPNGDVA